MMKLRRDEMTQHVVGQRVVRKYRPTMFFRWHVVHEVVQDVQQRYKCQNGDDQGRTTSRQPGRKRWHVVKTMYGSRKFADVWLIPKWHLRQKFPRMSVQHDMFGIICPGILIHHDMSGDTYWMTEISTRNVMWKKNQLKWPRKVIDFGGILRHVVKIYEML